MNTEELNQKIANMEAELASMKALVNKPKPVVNYWQPDISKGEIYYYVNYLGLIKYDSANESSIKRYRVFKTEDEAQRYAEYIKAEETLKAEIARLNGGWWPDWSNKSQVKSFIYFGDHFDWSSCFTNKCQPTFMYLKSGTLAKQLIETHSAELKAYLSY